MALLLVSGCGSRATGSWKPIAAPPVSLGDPYTPKVEVVGRFMFVDWGHVAASYDPCRRVWVQHQLPPNANTQHSPRAIGNQKIVMWFNNRSRLPLLLDPTVAAATSFAGPPNGFFSGGPPLRKVGPGALAGWKQFYFEGQWFNVDASNAPPSYAYDAATESPVGELRWGGARGTEAIDGGAFFDAGRKRWHTLPTNGGPGPRARASVTWTGAEFMVTSGTTSLKLPGSRNPLTDGALYNPKTNTWRRVAGSPAHFLASTAMAGHVVLMSQKSAALLRLDTLKWQTFPYRRRAFAQNVIAAHGTAAVVEDAAVRFLSRSVDGDNHEWVEVPLPPALHQRFGRSHLITKHHLIIWGGKRHVSGPNGCENSSPGQNCLPAANTETATTGFAWQLSACSDG